jgi:hypothetical protein
MKMPEIKHSISPAPPRPETELITTITRVARILMLALFFVSLADFSLDSARFDLVVMAAALAIFLSGGLRSP